MIDLILKQIDREGERVRRKEEAKWHLLEACALPLWTLQPLSVMENGILIIEPEAVDARVLPPILTRCRKHHKTPHKRPDCFAGLIFQDRNRAFGKRRVYG